MILLGSFLALDTNGFEDISDMGLLSSQARSLAGRLISSQSQYVDTQRRYNLSLDMATAKRLREFAATTRQPFNFIDHEGFSWLTTTGTDDDLRAYSTGAYFAPGQRFVERPSMGSGYDCNNFWTLPITFIINARGWRGNSVASGGELDMIPQQPSGTMNGVNAVFVLTYTPVTLILVRNGIAQTPGVSYNLSGNTITFTAGNIPNAGDSLYSWGTA